MKHASVTTVLLCRSCCCGTDKHPGTDHDQQRVALERAAAEHPGVEVRVVECLDECDRSNVVVVRRPGSKPRAADRDTWLGGVLSERATAALTAWVTEGAPEPVPLRLAGHRFRHLPPRRRKGG